MINSPWIALIPWASAALAPVATPHIDPARVGAAHSGEHRFCGWLAGSRDPAAMNEAYDTFAAHAGDFDAVHPMWWHVAGRTRIEPKTIGLNDRRVLDNTTPGGKRTKLIPTIQATIPAEYESVHAIINDPELRRRHVAAIVDIVVENGYDGIDLDYEHLSEALERGQTLENERHAFDALVTEVARALHEAGRTLSLALPVVGSARGVYDYEALSGDADQIHVMGYDFHYEDGPHAGPVAPLGWIRDAVSYIDGIAGGERREKFILGVPNYGLVGPEAKECSPTSACLALVAGRYQTTTSHMDHCSMTEGYDVDPGRSPNALLPNGDRVFFDDLASLEQKVEVAERGGLGGITYWSIGGEPDTGWRTFFQMVRSHFPRADR